LGLSACGSPTITFLMTGKPRSGQFLAEVFADQPERMGRTPLPALLVRRLEVLIRKKEARIGIAGQRCPLVGRISMDLCIADVTDLPEEAARPGNRAEFFGAAAELDDFATRSGTIGYNVLTGLGARYRRVYRERRDG
jgi:Alanine racemase, C-terminal domain